MTDLSKLKLHERLALAKSQLDPIQSDYRVVFEADIDSPSAILIPDPNWMACAMNGGILPPVSVYHDLQYDEKGAITNGHILHDTPPIGPMTEEEAIEYLIQKDVPRKCWEASDGNSKKLVICKANQLPTTRSLREAWRINQENTNDQAA